MSSHFHDGARHALRVLPIALIAACFTSCATLSGSLDQLKAQSTEDTPPAKDPTPAPTATLALDDGADWIQLVSGEWLRGEILRIRDGSLDFDSDELDDQTFDFDDIKQVFSPNHQVVLTEDGRVFEGTVTADEKSIWIVSDKTVQLTRAEMLSVLAVNGDSATSWFGELSLGTVFRRGNTTQTDYSAFASLTRETARTRWLNKYTGAIGKVNGTETTNNHRLGSTYDVFLTKRAFVTVPGVDVFRDQFQNIAYRVTPYAALGYEVVDTAAHSLSLSAGPAYQYTVLDSSATGVDDEDGTIAAIFSSKYGWDITSDVEFNFDYSITAPIPDTDAYNHNFVLKLSVDLLGDLDLDIAFIWDRVNKPQLDGDGNQPLQDDYRTTIGLGWSF